MKTRLFIYVLLFICMAQSCSKEQLMSQSPQNPSETLCDLSARCTPFTIYDNGELVLDTVYWREYKYENDQLVSREVTSEIIDTLIYKDSKLLKVIQKDSSRIYHEHEYYYNEEGKLESIIRVAQNTNRLHVDSIYYEDGLIVQKINFHSALDLDTPLISRERLVYQYDDDNNLITVKTYKRNHPDADMETFLGEEFYDGYTEIRNPFYSSPFYSEFRTSLQKYLYSYYEKDWGQEWQKRNISFGPEFQVNEYNYPSSCYRYICK